MQEQPGCINFGVNLIDAPSIRLDPTYCKRKNEGNTGAGESAASAIIENLVNAGSSYLKEYPAASGMQDELNQLSNALPQVQAVLTAVEGGGPVMVQNKAVDTWLWQLRDAVENAENVLDELEYYKLENAIQDRDDKDYLAFFGQCKSSRMARHFVRNLD